MRLALISDIHANLDALEATFADIARHDVARVVCLGDIVGYNTQPAECIALIRRIDALCVAGNHDLAVCGRITMRDFSKTAARAAAWTQRQLGRDDLIFLSTLPLRTEIDGELVAVHGALHAQSDCAIVRLDNEERRMQSFRALMADPSGARVGAFGHTHDAAIYRLRSGEILRLPDDEVALQRDAFYLLNPGTVGQPRARDRRASYMVLDFGERTVSLHRVSYDASLTRAATRRAGLAPSFMSTPMCGAIASGLRTLRLHRPAKQLASYLGL